MNDQKELSLKDETHMLASTMRWLSHVQKKNLVKLFRKTHEDVIGVWKNANQEKKLWSKEANKYEKYVFTKQLSYHELDAILSKDQFNRERTKEEVDDLMKNNIIKDAYIENRTLNMIVDEHMKTGFPFILVDYWKDIEMDLSEWMETPRWTMMYPNTILAFTRTGEDSIQEVTKNGTFSSSNKLTKEFLDKYIETILSKWAVELNSIYWWNDPEDLLKKVWIRRVLKKSK